jgi:hypothetical protein
MRTRQAQQGVSLIEALIALLVAGFGMLALVAMQITLARSADVARQRGEATRLAQQKVEQWRTFTSLASLDGTTDITETFTGAFMNTVFTRTATLTTDLKNTHRVVQVAVAWEDRASERHQLDLRTVIARLDPMLSGEIEFPPPGNQALRRPKNRNMNIPVPAKELGGGKSSLPFVNGGSIVFGNDSGTVVKQCSFVVQTLSDLDDARCVTLDAYLLAGYVTKSMSSFPASLGVNASLITGATGTVQCIFGDASDQNIDPATNLSRVSAPSKYDIVGTKYYLCVVPVASGGGTWSGDVRLSGMAAGADYLVCRFEYDKSQGGTDNERHPAHYDKVDTSLDNQNYIITTNSTCPIVGTLQTQPHQNCRASNSQRATECPAS